MTPTRNAEILDDDMPLTLRGKTGLQNQEKMQAMVFEFKVVKVLIAVPPSSLNFLAQFRCCCEKLTIKVISFQR